MQLLQCIIYAFLLSNLSAKIHDLIVFAHVCIPSWLHMSNAYILPIPPDSYAGGASVSSLEYFTLTSPTYLPYGDDESSEAIDIPGGFPFGSQNFSSIFVR